MSMRKVSECEGMRLERRDEEISGTLEEGNGGRGMKR